MPVTLDDTGRYLIDDDEVVRGVKHSAACVARVLELAYGTVFQQGLGAGDIRAALNEVVGGDLVERAVAAEETADVIAYYEDLYPVDVGNVAENDPVTALEEQITPPGPPFDPFFAWTMGIFDLSVTPDLATDVDFIDGLKTLWPDAGGRVVVLAERDDITLAGFALGDRQLIDGTYLYIFDRFDPDDAVGVADPHGVVDIPGYGWQAP